jgi:Cu-Zn family superoxide dismutase
MRRLALAAVIAAAASAACATAPAPPDAQGVLKASDGRTVGTVTLKQGPHGVLVTAVVNGLTPGWHGAHFHAVGNCDDPKFLNSGGHVNHATEKRPHGLLNPQGPDFGDLTNLYVGPDGRGGAQWHTPLVSLSGAGGKPALLDTDGSALVIHANPDDHLSQPIGGAGDRVACAVLGRMH